jgi:GntR family transcriptional regulator
MQNWDHNMPIYQQLADQLASEFVDGKPREGEPLPSVQALASRYLLNPLIVNRALQALAEEGLVEIRLGLGAYLRPGARKRLREIERNRFLDGEWPQLRARLRRLGIAAEDLGWEEH